MPLADELPADLNLSEADRLYLNQIERLARQSRFRRTLGVLGAIFCPALFAGLYVGLMLVAAQSRLALCELKGPVYIPVPGSLEKWFRLPIVMMFLAAVVWSAAIYKMQTDARLLYRILTQLKRAQ